jgi:hypothetical protein
MVNDSTKTKSNFLRRIESLAVFQGEIERSCVVKLCCLAEAAHACRDYGAVARAAELLGQHTSERIAAIAAYYRAISINAGSERGAELVPTILGSVTNSLPEVYQQKARATLAATYFFANPEHSLVLCQAGLQAVLRSATPHILTLFLLRRNHASLRALLGNRVAGLEELNQLESLARSVGLIYPAYYHDYLNSVAVELGSSGYLDQAIDISRRVCLSPFAANYPAWTETLAELRATESGPCSVPISSPLAKVLPMPTQRWAREHKQSWIVRQILRLVHRGSDRQLDEMMEFLKLRKVS